MQLLLRLAWDIFRCWTTTMGQRLGVKKKTWCTASAFDKHGKAIPAKAQAAHARGEQGGVRALRPGR